MENPPNLEAEAFIDLRLYKDHVAPDGRMLRIYLKVHGTTGELEELFASVFDINKELMELVEEVIFRMRVDGK